MPFAVGSQFAVEEFGSGAVGADPIAPPEQVVNFVGDLGSHGNADVLNDICSVGSTLNHDFQGSGKDDACKIITVAAGELEKISYTRVWVESRSKDGKFNRVVTTYAAGMGSVQSGLIA